VLKICTANFVAFLAIFIAVAANHVPVIVANLAIALFFFVKPNGYGH
jgi:hypothetical protein